MSASNPQIKVRPFAAGDLQRVQEIFSTGFDQYKTEKDGALYENFVKSKLNSDMGDIQKHYIDIEGGNFWVAEDVTQETPMVVGIVGVLPSTDADSTEANTIRAFELLRMSIDIQYEGKGVAQLLIKALERFVFSEQNADKLVLATSANMRRAVRFYEKQNYTKTRLEYYNECTSIQHFEKLCT